jgi:hypothetical protein
MRRIGLWQVLRVAVIAAAAAAVLSFAVMSLWNALMPEIFAVKAISFWQALGLLALSKLLFGGFRGFPAGGPRWRRRMWDRWEQMTPEEREKFKQGMRRRCGPRGPQEAEAQA